MNPKRRVVQHDNALGMAGVFKPLKRGPRGKLDVQTTWGDAVIGWRGADELGISDQSVLFAVLEVAADFLAEEPAQARATFDDELWPMLGHVNHVFRDDTVRVTTTFARLSHLCGWAGGGTADRRVRQSLRRLTETTVWARRDNKDGTFLEGSSRLLAWQIGDRHRVELIVNWRLAQAMRGIEYKSISLLERAALKTEVAQALHALLACRIETCGAWNCGLDKLQVHIWGNAAVGVNLRARRSRMRAALAAIDKLPGWRVRFSSSIARISRGPARTLNAVVPAYQSRGGVSATPRRSCSAPPAVLSQPCTPECSTGAASSYFDVSVEFSIRE